jgi:alpha-tubulin suppressor-like RCC1 family protein
LPTRVPQLTDVDVASAGDYHYAVAHRDGTVSGWGANLSGQLGDGSTTPRPVPVQAVAASGVVLLSSGGASTYVAG